MRLEAKGKGLGTRYIAHTFSFTRRPRSFSFGVLRKKGWMEGEATVMRSVKYLLRGGKIKNVCLCTVT